MPRELGPNVPVAAGSGRPSPGVVSQLLLSMTGFGEAHRQQDGLTVAVEVRTINNRYFKLSVKCGEGYGGLEGEIEALIRKQVRRGTVQVDVRVGHGDAVDQYRLNKSVLLAYRKQLDELNAALGGSESAPLASLLLLPGVAAENRASSTDLVGDWPVIESTLVAALANLTTMRADEGRAMATDLRANCQTIATHLSRIEGRAGLVVEGYRTRLEERLRKVLAEFEITLDPTDLIKEVSIYAERSDISEETVRLRSHLDQFDEIMALPDSAGRRLEFLTQEMFRETNTIGSKSNDVEISRDVIEIKAAIERIREMIQNIE